MYFVVDKLQIIMELIFQNETTIVSNKRLFYGHESNEHYRTFLGQNFVSMPEYGLFFRRSKDGTIDFTTPIRDEDMFLNLMDYGMKLSNTLWKNLKKSSSIENISPLSLFYNQLLVNKWDKEDRIELLVKAMNLKYDFSQNFQLIRKWLINTYSVAFRDIDKEIDFAIYPRVAMILHSDQRALGKTEFFRKIGLSGVMSKQFNNAGFEIYCESQASLPNDKHERANYLCNHLIFQIDDIDQLLIRGGGELRSIITQKSASIREMYSQANKVKNRTAGIAGTTNNLTLLRDKTENRYMVFTLKGKMDFSLLNSIDIVQLWAQIREEAIQSGEDCKFSFDELEMIKNFASDYIFTNPLDDFLESNFEYDYNSCMVFAEIKAKANVESLSFSDKELGSALKRLAPEGQEIKKKSNREYCYRLRTKSIPSKIEYSGRSGYDNSLPF
jgi:hypothetical protein